MKSVIDCAEALDKKTATDADSALTVNPDTPNVLQSMMKFERVNAHAKNANKVALETEKEKDSAEKTVEGLKRQLQPKRARTDDDAGDAHGKGPWDGLGVMVKTKVTLDIMDGKERTMTGKITSPILVAQHLRATFCKKEWFMEHVNTPINEIVMMYQSAEQIIRPPAPTDVSVWKGIMSYFSFLFLGVPRHYAKRPFTRGAVVRKIQGVGNSTFVLSVENDNDFRSRCD